MSKEERILELQDNFWIEHTWAPFLEPVIEEPEPDIIFPPCRTGIVYLE
jgi:hypothetical protein